jgi:betaine-aldehyde dehydrogenase
MPFDDSTTMGPLISGIQRERVNGFVERAKSQGAKILAGGGVPKDYQKGYYFEPTVIDAVQQDWEIVQSEVFGPVITIQEFDNEAQASAVSATMCCMV